MRYDDLQIGGSLLYSAQRTSIYMVVTRSCSAPNESASPTCILDPVETLEDDHFELNEHVIAPPERYFDVTCPLISTVHSPKTQDVPGPLVLTGHAPKTFKIMQRGHYYRLFMSKVITFTHSQGKHVFIDPEHQAFIDEYVEKQFDLKLLDMTCMSVKGVISALLYTDLFLKHIKKMIPVKVHSLESAFKYVNMHLIRIESEPDFIQSDEQVFVPNH